MDIRRLLWRLRRNQRGTTALEFAIVAPVFFLLLMVAGEIIFSLLADATLENAASRITRMGKIGTFTAVADCQTAVKDELEKTLGIWTSAEDIYVNAKIYQPGNPIVWEDEDDQRDLACDTGDHGDMVVFRFGFYRPGLTGVLGLMGINLLHYERVVVIQNEP